MLVSDGEHIPVLRQVLLTYLYRLISASVGTVVYYGFQCHPNLGNFFIACCFLTGVAGNVFPFQRWFNDPAYRVSCPAFLHTPSTNGRQYIRIVFFLCMAFTAIAPLAVLAYLHSVPQVVAYTSKSFLLHRGTSG